MLEYNGYSYKNEDNQYIFKHSALDAIGLSIVLLITALIVIAIMFINIFIGLGALALSLLIFAPIVKRSKGRSSLIIDPAGQLLKIQENERTINKAFGDVQGVFTHSMFVDEYSSAFKSTSKEFRITIGLEVVGRKIPLFMLIGDHTKPSKEMNEVHDFLESVISEKSQN